MTDPELFTADPADNLFEAEAAPAAPAARPYAWDDADAEPLGRGGSRRAELRETLDDWVARARDGVATAVAARRGPGRRGPGPDGVTAARRLRGGEAARWIAPGALGLVAFLVLVIVVAWPGGGEEPSPERGASTVAARRAPAPPAITPSDATQLHVARFAARPDEVVARARRLVAARAAAAKARALRVAHRRAARKAAARRRRRAAAAPRQAAPSSAAAPVAQAPAAAPQVSRARSAPAAPAPPSNTTNNEFTFER